MDVHGKHLGKNAYGIGSVHWNAQLGEWRCLACVGSLLCVVEVTIEPEHKE